jgi:anti-sigma factor RsiW
MHAAVIDRLEDYLSGTLDSVGQRELEAHLNVCEICREEVQSIQGISHSLASLRSDEIFDPSPGFYARIRQQVRSEGAVPTFASLFSLDFAFGRRLAFASLLTLAILGSYLVSRESAYSSAPSPESVMAQQELPDFDSGPARDNMLVTLTAYEH